jgi:hypothetical protein
MSGLPLGLDDLLEHSSANLNCGVGKPGLDKWKGISIAIIGSSWRSPALYDEIYVVWTNI